jgi:hypothetical protein
VSATHEGKYEKIKPSSFSEAEEEELKALLKSEVKALLKYTKVQAAGIGGKPTVQFSGANVQVVSGTGKTEAVNGEGNLVIGYDEGTHPQTGSHNLILGENQEFTGYADVVAGLENAATGRFGSVSGRANLVSSISATVSGGYENHATNEYASVSGGERNTADGLFASVSGGNLNEAYGWWSTIGGGQLGKTAGYYSSISGGSENHTEIGSDYASISGGAQSRTFARWSWIGGGNLNETGLKATEAQYSAIFGGKGNSTFSEFQAIP